MQFRVSNKLTWLEFHCSLPVTTCKLAFVALLSLTLIANLTASIQAQVEDSSPLVEDIPSISQKAELIPSAPNSNVQQTSETISNESVSPVPSAIVRPAMLNSLYQNQWIKLDNGSFSGSVVSIVDRDVISLEGAMVMLSQNGQKVDVVQSGANGKFRFSNLKPGYYALLIDSDRALAAIGLTILDGNAAKHLPNAIEVRTILPKSARLGELLLVTQPPSLPEALVDRTPPQSDPIEKDRKFANTHLVKLTADGDLVGSVARVGKSFASDNLGDVAVYVLNGETQVASSNVDSNGNFLIDGLPAGCYGLVAVGPRDIAACSFCVVDNRVAMNSTSTGSRYVNTQSAAAEQINVEMAQRTDMVPPTPPATDNPEGEEVVVQDRPAPVGPLGAGGMPMAGAGQVIGGSGSGGLPIGGAVDGLLGAAGLAGVIYAISEATEETPIVSRVVPR